MKIKMFFISMALLLAAIFITAPVYAQGYKWSFDDAAAGTAGWVVASDEFWEYNGTAELSRDTAALGKPMLRFDVDYTNDSGNWWSESKIKCVFNEPVPMTGVSRFVFDIYIDPNMKTKGGFKIKVMAFNDKTTLAEGETDTVRFRDDPSGYQKATVTIRVPRSTRQMTHTVLGLAGAQTNYKGPVFFDNIRWE